LVISNSKNWFGIVKSRAFRTFHKNLGLSKFCRLSGQTKTMLINNVCTNIALGNIPIELECSEMDNFDPKKTGIWQTSPTLVIQKFLW